MTDLKDIRNRLFRLQNEKEFDGLALEIFRYQYANNRIYREFSDLIRIHPGSIDHYRQIPFLPVSFFRDQEVVCREHDWLPDVVFTSSGTTGIAPSRHIIKDLSLYRESFIRSFSSYYGNPESFRFLVLLPGYLDRQGSSLVYMMEELVRKSKANGSGFFLKDFQALSQELMKNPATAIRTILFGASYALLDYASGPYSVPVEGIVMETGGMKGRHKEVIREELHDLLCKKLKVNAVHSEYGMTELLSQAYSPGNGIFRTPAWMKILVRDINDPLQILPPGHTGGLNIIDLANLHSCAFISTQDLGKAHEDGSFEVLGRFDDSDLRGCNLLVV